MKKIGLYILIAVVIAGGVGFFAGMRIGSVSGANTGSAFQSGTFGGGSGSFMRNGRSGGMQGNGTVAGVAGNIIAKDNTSVTVQIPNGSTKIVFYSDTTKIMKSVDGTSSDLTGGENVLVTGTPNQDGSITGETIQIRPANATSTSR